MTRRPPPLQIGNAPPSNSIGSFVPELKWPSLDSNYSKVDLPRFPSQAEEILRFGAGKFGSWSEGFVSAIRTARSRVWLLDGFLLKKDEHVECNFTTVFGDVFGRTSAQDIRLLTSKKDGHQEQIESLRDLQESRRAPPRYESFTIDIRFVRGGRSGIRLPHDRFALIDDELWHWGANVGGTHHEINAFSRGWSAQDTEAPRYFDHIWQNAERLT